MSKNYPWVNNNIERNSADHILYGWFSNQLLYDVVVVYLLSIFTLFIASEYVIQIIG